jgi:hypothetical protein
MFRKRVYANRRYKKQKYDGVVPIVMKVHGSYAQDATGQAIYTVKWGDVGGGFGNNVTLGMAAEWTRYKDLYRYY